MGKAAALHTTPTAASKRDTPLTRRNASPKAQTAAAVAAWAAPSTLLAEKTALP